MRELCLLSVLVASLASAAVAGHEVEVGDGDEPGAAACAQGGLLTPAPPPVDLAARLEDALDASRKRSFRKVRTAFRFEYWSDLERGRVLEFVKIMNPFYDRLKGFFRVSKTDIGVPVQVYASRSDYLEAYARIRGRSGERTWGFHVPDIDNPLLCFFDRRHDDGEVIDTAKHESTHLLVTHTLGGGRCPRWLDEGLATYFAADGPERAGPYVASCILTARHLVRHGVAPTLRELSERPPGSMRFDDYALAWSWVAYLMEDDGTRRRLSRLFDDLREMAQERDTTGWTSDDWQRAGNELFWAEVAPSEDLLAGWEAFVRGLRPQTPAQAVFAAQRALRHAEGQVGLRPALTTEERLDMLHDAELWLDQAAASDDSDQVAWSEVLSVRAARIRAGLADAEAGASAQGQAQAQAQAAALNEGLQRLDALLASPAGAARAGSIAEELEFLMTGRLAAGASPDVLACGTELTRRAALMALADDPLDSRALGAWAEVTGQHAPDELAAIYPLLLARAQVDPDEQQLTVLAVAAVRLGGRALGDGLFARARVLAVDPGRVDRRASALAEVVPRAAAHAGSCPTCPADPECKRCRGTRTWGAHCGNCRGQGDEPCPVCEGLARRSCNNCLGDGVVNWKSGAEDRCKLCSKGLLPCRFCDRKGRIPCSECEGEGRLPRPCEACLALGGLPCPVLPEAAVGAGGEGACGVCAGTRRMPCLTCLGEAHEQDFCDDCGGWGRRDCPECYQGLDPCDRCAGTGRVRSVVVGRRTPSGASRCDDCRGKGVADCPVCDGEGITACEVWQPGASCATCEGQGAVPCVFCEN